MLKDQGWQENRKVTFMTDGADTGLNIAHCMAPASEHIRDISECVARSACPFLMREDLLPLTTIVCCCIAKIQPKA